MKNLNDISKIYNLLETRYNEFSLSRETLKNIVINLQLDRLKENNLADLLMEFWLFLDNYREIPKEIINGEVEEFGWMEEIIEKFIEKFEKQNKIQS